MLVATTVIEVGVDVPNATVMVILDADRFGIAQLHQLRGRVGRGVHASTCWLVTQPSRTGGNPRVEALVASTDGFELAEVDLELRGEGTIMNTAQKGRNDLKLASLRRDRELVVAGPRGRVRDRRRRSAARGPSRAARRAEPVVQHRGRGVPVQVVNRAVCTSAVVAAAPPADEFGHLHGHVAPAALDAFWPVWRIDESFDACSDETRAHPRWHGCLWSDAIGLEPL